MGGLSEGGPLLIRTSCQRALHLLSGLLPDVSSFMSFISGIVTIPTRRPTFEPKHCCVRMGQYMGWGCGKGWCLLQSIQSHIEAALPAVESNIVTGAALLAGESNHGYGGRFSIAVKSNHNHRGRSSSGRITVGQGRHQGINGK
jgi:hypothetical protein